MKNKAGRGKIVIMMVALLLVFLVIFYFLANRERPDDLTRLSATESTIQKNLDINYPQTPKAVVRYYAELSQCMYDPSNTESEIAAIAEQSRYLFDEELKAQQSDQEYLQSLKTTIASFLRDSRKIVSFTISPSSEVVYSKTDIGEMASLFCTYTMQKGSVSYTDSEHFLLRKDASGRWKILGWQSAGAGAEAIIRESKAPEESAPEKTEEKKETAPQDTLPGETGNEKNVVVPEIKVEAPTVEIPTVEINVP